MTKPFHDQSNLRLEIETPVTGLPNLVKNPSGAKGAWFWLTPVANTAMSSSGNILTFTTTTSQACNFRTDFMPVAATKWAAARITFPSIGTTAGHNIKVRFEWYDAAKVLLSSSTQSGAFGPSGFFPMTHYLAAVQAPASTAYVKLRADFYNGSGNPSAGATVAFTLAMVTWADTNSFTTTRTNLLTNPSFEVNTTGWTCSDTHARSTAQFAVGTASDLLTKTGISGDLSLITSGTGTGAIPVTGGATYTVQFRTRPGSTARNVEVKLVRYNAAGAYVGFINHTVAAQTAAAWTTHSKTAITLPADTAYVAVTVLIKDCAVSETHYVDALLLEKADTLGSYFDGATTDTGTINYSWTGTAHASTSTAVNTEFDYTDPTTWRNILGPTFEVGIARTALDIGTITARISDALLDPAETDDVRPGRLVRLQALIAGEWASVYEGKLTKAHVSYDRDKATNKENTIVSLVGVDNTATLANRLEARGVATVAELPYLLEGKAVPWNCNGSGNQVTSATVVSKNENASVLDQVALTRDTVLGYAWVDRTNVLQVWDSASLPATVACTYTDAASVDPAEDGYGDIAADFDTDRAINEVLVKWLRYNTVTGVTEEIPYGPYRDQTSIDTWGPFSAEFTIHGATESGATIATYAASILTANATPERRANSITVPVVDARSMGHAATVDLYSLVHVTYGTKVDEDYRVTGVSHTITPKKWLVSYAFDVTGSVAAPQVTPAPPSVPAGPPFSSRYRTADATLVTATFTDISHGTTRGGTETGISYSGSTWTVDRAGTYVVAVNGQFAGNATGRRIIRIMINGAEASRVEIDNAGTSAVTPAVTRIRKCEVGDTIVIQAWQNSGGNLAYNAGSNFGTDIAYLGD